MTPKERKDTPVATGVLDYFPDALMAVAQCSFVGNEQHNPGTPLHWDRSKSGDEGDALIRHFLDRGKMDTDGVMHSAKVAWRALALLQKEIELSKQTETSSRKALQRYTYPPINTLDRNPPAIKSAVKRCPIKDCGCQG